MVGRQQKSSLAWGHGQEQAHGVYRREWLALQSPDMISYKIEAAFGGQKEDRGMEWSRGAVLDELATLAEKRR